MRFKAAIFDLDGTLLNSMGMWSNLGREFLIRHGIDEEIDLDEKLGVVSIHSALEYLIKEYKLDISIDEASAETWQMVEDFYRYRVQLKLGAMEVLDYLQDNNIPCGIITATELRLVTPALERTKLKPYFREVLSCVELKTSKRTPGIFFQMSEILGVDPCETIVFEDALYAAETAQNAGFKVAAIYDHSEKNSEKLKEISDYYYSNWDECRSDLTQNSD